MNLQQLRSLCEVVKQDLHISGAATALHTSQPGVSRQMLELEQDLGVDIFVRQRNRITGLTKPGRQLLEVAQRVVRDTDDMRHIAFDYVGKNDGDLVIATTHTHARYVLPTFIKQFSTAYPLVRVGLRQGSPSQCYKLVASGEADIVIGPEVDDSFEDLAMLSAYRLARSLVTLRNHPLRKEKHLTIAKLAKYPIIAFDSVFRSRRTIEETFSRAGLKPNISLSVIDADVGKAYVEIDMGIAVLPTITINRNKDKTLYATDVSHLFLPGIIYVAVRRSSYLRLHVHEFIAMFAPHLNRETVNHMIAGRPKKGLRLHQSIPFV